MIKTITYPLVISVMLLCLVLPRSAAAQHNDRQPVQLLFGGYHKIHFETSDEQRFGSEYPLTFMRWELHPTVGVYGVPLSMNLLYTTEDNDPGGNTSRLQFGLSLSTDQLENSIRERIQKEMDQSMQQMMEYDLSAGIDTGFSEIEGRMDQLADLQANLDVSSGRLDELQNLGLLTSAERLALRFPVLGIGASYPQYSRYVMQGITVNGFHVEFMPGRAYLGGNIGNIRNPRAAAGFSQFEAFDNDRRVYAGRLGAGRPFGRHIHLMGVFVEESQKETVLNGSQNFGRPEMKNAVTGISFRIGAVQNNLDIKGEIAGSFITRDTDAPEMDTPDFGNVPLIPSLIHANSSSSADAAGSIEADLKLPDSDMRLFAGLHYTGPGYTNLAAPSLRNDILEYSGGVEQSFFRRQMTLRFNIRNERNNLDELKHYTRTSTRFDLQLALNPRGLPWVRLHYIPVFQKNRPVDSSVTTTGEYYFNTTVVNAASGYTLPVGPVMSTTSINVSGQFSDSDIVSANTTSYSLGLNQNAGIGNTNLGAGYQRFSFTRLGETTVRHDIHFNGSIRIKNSWIHEAGFRNSSGAQQAQITGFYYRSSITIRYLGTLEAIVENNRFNNSPFFEGIGGQTRFSTSLTKTW